MTPTSGIAWQLWAITKKPAQLTNERLISIPSGRKGGPVFLISICTKPNLPRRVPFVSKTAALTKRGYTAPNSPRKLSFLHEIFRKLNGFTDVSMKATTTEAAHLTDTFAMDRPWDE